MPVDKEEEAEVIKEYTYWLYLFVALERERATLHREVDITPEILMVDKDYVMDYTRQTLDYLYWREQCPQRLTEKINDFATRVLEKFSSLEETRKSKGQTPLEVFSDHFTLDHVGIYPRPMPDSPFELPQVLSPSAAELDAPNNMDVSLSPVPDSPLELPQVASPHISEHLSPPEIFKETESDSNDNTADVSKDFRVIKSVNISNNEDADTRWMKKSKISKVKSFFARLRISPRCAIYRAGKTVKFLRQGMSAAFRTCAARTSEE